VSTIDVKTRTKHPTDIPVRSNPYGVAFTPDGKTAFVTNTGSGTVSTIDVKTRTKHPTDIPVGTGPKGLAVTPDGKTAFVINGGSLVTIGEVPATVGDSVSTIDVKTRTKHPADIPVGTGGAGVAITPDGKTAFVTNANFANLGNDSSPSRGTVSTIDVKTRTKHPTDIPVGTFPFEVAITPCSR
jgi:YVTN family beta-propeller protein